MTTFLLIVLILDAMILVTVILLQSGKGGGMAASFGGASSSSDQFMGTRQAGNLLTKMSWWCDGLFIVISFILSIMASRGRTPTSVLDKSFSAPKAPASAPTAPAGAAPAQNAPAPAGGDVAKEAAVQLPAFTISSEKFEKTEQELLAYEMPITKIIEENSVKDIQAIEDRQFLLYVEACVQAGIAPTEDCLYSQRTPTSVSLPSASGSAMHTSCTERCCL